MADDADEVGYKRPPRARRFKPGISGNPAGRPKGSRSLSNEVRAALGRVVTVTEEGHRRKITVLDATLRRLVEKAISKGDLRAIQQVLILADTYGLEAAQPALASEDRALLDAAVRRLAEVGISDDG